jgi:hypothetical protein
MHHTHGSGTKPIAPSPLESTTSLHECTLLTPSLQDRHVAYSVKTIGLFDGWARHTQATFWFPSLAIECSAVNDEFWPQCLLRRSLSSGPQSIGHLAVTLPRIVCNCSSPGATTIQK